MTLKTKLMASIILTITVLLFFMIVRSFVVHNYEFKLNIIGDKTTIVEVGEEYNDLGFAFSPERNDLIDSVITESNVDTNKVGEYTVTYSLKLTNREVKNERKVIVKDTTPPILKINSLKDIYTIKNTELLYPDCTAIDNYDGDITDKIVVDSNIDFSKIGVYQINYSVKDSSDNTAKETINIHVEETKNAYIEVAIKKQKLYYYEFNELVLESDVVTGIYDKTPYGTFSVINKARNIMLRGINYNSFVEYWIDFKDHTFGFHDASWRNKFGGEIYITDGSHGCVNMPKDKVAELYDLVTVGTPVYIHS